jgi:hypothetical protein
MNSELRGFVAEGAVGLKSHEYLCFRVGLPFAVFLLTVSVFVQNVIAWQANPMSYNAITNTHTYRGSAPTLGAAGTTTTDPDFRTKVMRITQSGSCSLTSGYSFASNEGTGWSRTINSNGLVRSAGNALFFKHGSERKLRRGGASTHWDGDELLRNQS